MEGKRRVTNMENAANNYPAYQAEDADTLSVQTRYLSPQQELLLVLQRNKKELGYTVHHSCAELSLPSIGGDLPTQTAV